MKRRTFIQYSALATSSLIPAFSFAQKETLSNATKITILHTNDQHSRIEPFEKSDNPALSQKGGFARRAQLIQDIRKREPNVVLLDSGDIFQGTPYFNFYGGALEFKLMSKMQYDVATMGNHDFDNGLDGFKKQLPLASFDFVCSNYDFTHTVLEGLTKPYKILQRQGIKIGVFGVGIELKGLVTKSLYQETQYLDPIEIATDTAKKLREVEKCDLVVCLSHLGYDYPKQPDKISDIHLAKKTAGIDLILGGHTHTFLPKPVEYTNKEGKTVLVNQVGWAGLYLGRIDFYFEKGKKQNITTYALETGLIDNKELYI